MRPWKLASETATLDDLSNGRVILSVGLRAVDTGFAEFGEVTDRKTRAELLDEGLDVLTGLWGGQPFTYAGKHYRIKACKFPHQPPAVQKPRIPIWVVGAWPRQKSMQRVLRWDGLLPAKLTAKGKHEKVTPDDVRAMRIFIDENRTETSPFDIVMEGTTSGDQNEEALSEVRQWAEAGATWWLEAMWDVPQDRPEVVKARIQKGPPRID